jgi:integrase/recombinase XerD
MALEAVQAQAGHRSIESTRIYLHLADRWLADEYHRAIDALDGHLDAVTPRTALCSRCSQRRAPPTTLP